MNKSLTFLDKSMLPYLYKFLVRPDLEYTSSVLYMVSSFEKNNKSIEIVQRRATKFTQDIRYPSYKEGFLHLGFPFLEYRRCADVL